VRDILAHQTEDIELGIARRWGQVRPHITTELYNLQALVDEEAAGCVLVKQYAICMPVESERIF
jgi:hypothetical protein